MGHDEGLVATYNTQRPPWIGLWSSRNYTGRVDWWKEPGEKDDVARSGKLRLLRSRYREEDPDWFDAKVPDGSSLTGPCGLDSKKYKDVTKKADTPGDLAEFQQKVYEGSSQYRAIAEKFDLSREHPGLNINPTLNTLNLVPKWQLGRNAIIPNSWYSFGPRFFDKPLNEGTFTKALAALKYTAIAMVPYTLLEIRGMETVKVNELSFRSFFARYAKICPIPFAVSVSWAVALSAAANIRNKDDVRNHLYSSAAVGTVIATAKDSIPKGMTGAIVALVAGTFWHYARVSETGLQSKVSQPTSAGIWGGPLIWQSLNQADATVPQSSF